MKRPIALVLIALSIGLFYTFTRPQYNQVKDLRLVTAEYHNVLQNISRIIETRDTLLISYEAIPAAEVERLLKVLPNDVDSVRLALDLDTVASRYGISIKNIKVDTEVDENIAAAIISSASDNTYDKAKVSFSFVADYENFTLFLADLEKSLRIMDVKAVSFSVSENDLYEHQITLDTYWLKEQ